MERLQKPNIENVMEATIPRQSQVIGYLANVLHHAKLPRAARAKFSLGARLEGLGGALKEAQPHPVTNSELQLTVTAVVVDLCVVASLEKTFANVRQEQVTISEKVMRLLCAQHAWHVRKKRGRWSAIHHLKRRSSKRRMVGCVVAVLRPREPIDPSSWSISRSATRYIAITLLTTSDWPSL